jgi:outer membrane receptor for ferrienterochelin and colicin
MGLTDLQGNLSYAPSPQHRITMSMLFGSSRDDRRDERNRLGTNSFMLGDVKSGIVNLRWRWVQPHFVSQSSLYVVDDYAKNSNLNGELLFKSDGQEVGLRYDASLQISRRHRLESGVLVRRLSENSRRRRFTGTSGFADTSSYNTQTWQPGGYVEDSWVFGDRFVLSGGVRFDRFGTTGEETWSPRASGAVHVSRRTTVTASYGRVTQFPDFDDLYGDFGVRTLRAERSADSVVSVEHRFTERLRGRVELYDKQESSLIFAEETEPRLVAGKVVRPVNAPVLRNTLAGYSRGVEFYLQRRSANRLSGWISYAYGISRLRDASRTLGFAADFEQRHTVNAFASYRVSRALSLSSKYRYGSNFPVAGFFRFNGTRLFLADTRNSIRLPQYSRLDLRVDYAFHFERWKLTLSSEIANVLARRNARFTDLDSIVSTGEVRYTRQALIPFLPSAGIRVEF